MTGATIVRHQTAGCVCAVLAALTSLSASAGSGGQAAGAAAGAGADGLPPYLRLKSETWGDGGAWARALRDADERETDRRRRVSAEEMFADSDAGALAEWLEGAAPLLIEEGATGSEDGPDWRVVMFAEPFREWAMEGGRAELERSLVWQEREVEALEDLVERQEALIEQHRALLEERGLLDESVEDEQLIEWGGAGGSREVGEEGDGGEGASEPGGSGDGGDGGED